jgi:putative spermidine/putrescine transport system substrate-binding protein
LQWGQFPEEEETMSIKWRFDRKRRSFLCKSGAAVATATLGPLIITDRTIAQTRTLYVNSWGGSFTAAQEAAYFKPFTALTGIQIRTITPVSYGKIKAQVTTGRYEFDMTSINSMQWLRASREGLAEPIDWTIIKKDELSSHAVVANGHGIASNIQGTNLCYRRDKFPNGGPKSWADFWDVQKFPGRRSLCISDPPRTLIFALLADGVPADRLYPLDFDRAFKKLNEIKPHIKVWWREGNQSQQLIRDGEVDVMSIWNGRATELKQAGVPVELVWNGAVRSTSTWCVIKGAPNRKLAWEFIQFASQARPQAEFNKRLYYGPINPGAFEFIPHELAVQLPTYSENLAVSVREDDEWEADRITQIEERFTQWLAS